ncbi:alpha/beta fold hydrolase [Streptomyces flavotricini]|uniref:alpha/beta fold hydrolase n=1 Tax=Streptomyces flavotricini TaxID=66888 RepID=UPI001E51B380|nr:alpha/beta hydrolase [Streptomyces flavotricini]
MRSPPARTEAARGEPLAAPARPADGPPLVCLPGGPMRDSAYLGELGGLSAHRQLIMLDLRGTGRSELPADTGSYRCDRQVEDAEALRAHLGLDRIDLLGHSAGANLAVLYAGRHPERVGKLVLLTPSVMAAGITITGEARLETARVRRSEPWYPDAYAALEAVAAGRGTAGSRQAIAPFPPRPLGRRGPRLRRRRRGPEERRGGGRLRRRRRLRPRHHPQGTRGARRPVLVLAGGFDVSLPQSAAAEYAAPFPHGRLLAQPGAGHAPWLDDPERSIAATTEFLATAQGGNPA